MGPPRGQVKIEVDSSTLQNLIEQDNTEAATTVLTVNAEEEGESEVTYFVDEEGRYYYQSADNPQNLMTLPTVDNGEIEEESNQMLVEGTEAFQTVTLLPSDHVNGDVSYVLVVQEDTKPILTFQQPAEPGVKGETDDVYTFEEEEAEAAEAAEEEEEEQEEGKKKTKKGKSGWPKFTCTFCNYTSPRRYLLLRHMKSHSQERPHKCSVCERGFKTLASLQNHVNMHNGVKPHICKYCDSPFTTSGELVRHVRYKHTLERPHKCTECDYASVELSKLRRHIRCHTGERPYQCPHCTYASPDTFKLKRHLRTHTGEKPYKCDSCDMCFTQSNSLKAHKLIHNISNKPVYSCKLCPRTCGRKTDLRIHLQKLHSSDKPHKCKRCGKTFPDRYSCKIHNKTHEGEKCFKCGYCPYASTAMRHLKSHMLKHTDEKPFICEQCDQPFRQKQLLKRHQNLYHNPDYVPKPPKEKTHSCHECKRQFAHKGNLIRHLAVHDPDSDVQERALALKLGRQRKVKFVNGPMKPSKSIDVPSEEEDQTTLLKFNIGENDLKRGEVVTIDDGDSQQYVVLEVIELEDGTEQHVAVVAPHNGNTHVETDNEEEPVEEIVDPIKVQESKKAGKGGKRKQKEKKDVDSCFGFDEEDEEQHDFENNAVYVYCDDAGAQV